MAYFAPYIDSTGMHVPTYNDILEDLISSMKNIFGDDIYIDEDSQDYQQISIFAKKIFDTNSLAMLVYNNRTAITAIGYGLDNMCAMAGITRIPATYSTVQLTITGDEGTVITNGQASDGTYIWDLPEEVTIPSGGTITVQCRCETSGNITAAPNSITTIVTPQYGWIGVTNNYSASPGTNVETDAELRARYAASTLLPSATVLDGIKSAIQSIVGVTRCVIYENDTNTTDDRGLPPHSITPVVEGGDDLAIATQIFFKKTPGCYTNGTTEITITSEFGTETEIRFYRPTYKNVYVKVFLTKLSGYSESYEDNIKNAIVNYVNGLDISEKVFRQILVSVAISQMGSISSPAYAITDVQLSTDGTTYSSSDISMLFNEAGQCSLDKVSLVVT